MFSYSLSAVGMRTRMTETSGRTVDYTYDNLYRLTSETIAGDPYAVNGRSDYTMDVIGNRLRRDSTIQPAPPIPSKPSKPSTIRPMTGWRITPTTTTATPSAAKTAPTLTTSKTA